MGGRGIGEDETAAVARKPVVEGVLEVDFESFHTGTSSCLNVVICFTTEEISPFMENRTRRSISTIHVAIIVFQARSFVSLMLIMSIVSV